MTKKYLEDFLKLAPKAIYPLNINMSPDSSNLEYHVMRLSCRNAATHGEYVEFDVYEIRASHSTLGHDIKPLLHLGVKKNGVEVVPENGWTITKIVNYLITYFKEEEF